LSRVRVIGRGLLFCLGAILVLCAPSSFPDEAGQRLLFGIRAQVTLDGVPIGGWLPPEVSALLRQRYRLERAMPTDARLQVGSGKVIPARRGLEIDVARTLERVVRARPGEAVSSALIPIDPAFTERDIARITRNIGDYHTWVWGSEERLHNVALAARRLDHSLVMPGELFSFNEVVGPRTAAEGYKPAPVLVGQGTAMDAGGGVCQVASTLFNAVLAARLEVVERHPHSRPVEYVPKGRDATVLYDSLDFKFRNNTDEAIIIRSHVQGRNLTIRILAPDTP